MKNRLNLSMRDRVANGYLAILSIIGWTIILFCMVEFNLKGDLLILLLITLFLTIAELYPIPVWKGNTSISFPLVYTIYLIYGIEMAVVIYSIVVLAINISKARPVRIQLFNPALLALSLIAANSITLWIQYLLHTSAPSLLVEIIHMFSFTLSFYVFNNLLVDLLLILRPQRYSLSAWSQKTSSEIKSITIAIVYLCLLIMLGNQNRGVIDAFSFFFFFSPLIGFALLLSIIAKLQTEKRRLKSLFTITTELNRQVVAGNNFDSLHSYLSSFIDLDSVLLIANENGEWATIFSDGSFLSETEVTHEELEQMTQIKSPLLIKDRSRQSGPGDKIFIENMKSILYAPLVINEKTVGMLIGARSRTKSFTEEDISSIATLANQLAIVLKTRSLLEEQERRLIVEERNRIAREIHDGIAQSLAGVILKMEFAMKKHESNSTEAMKIVQENIENLRRSLRDVRESIYALRPFPTKMVGLKTSMNSVMEEVKREHNINFRFEIRGEPIHLSSMVEKVIFDIFKESLQNIIKHAKANQVDVLISYQTEHILLKVKDDGIGFSLVEAMVRAREEPHFGILNMNELAEQIEATFQINSKLGKGTEIVLTIPKVE